MTDEMEVLKKRMEKAEYIRDLARRLLNTYPEEGYGSYGSLFFKAYNNGDITDEDYSIARIHYGRLWNYVEK